MSRINRGSLMMIFNDNENRLLLEIIDEYIADKKKYIDNGGSLSDKAAINIHVLSVMKDKINTYMLAR
jgi:hypothetical protein